MPLFVIPDGVGVGRVAAALARDDRAVPQNFPVPLDVPAARELAPAAIPLSLPSASDGCPAAEAGPESSTRDAADALDLVAELQGLLEQPTGGRPRWWQCWTRVITHPWYRANLHAVAQRVARWTRTGSTAPADIEHGAYLLLARDLQRHPTLHRRLVATPARFAALMSRIIYRHCLQIYRRQRRHDQRTMTGSDSDPVAGGSGDLSLRLDLALCLQELAPELRRTVELHTQGFTQQEMARLEGVHQATISRRLASALEYLRKRLEPPDGGSPASRPA